MLREGGSLGVQDAQDRYREGRASSRRWTMAAGVVSNALRPGKAQCFLLRPGAVPSVNGAESTCWQVLRAAYLRVVCDGLRMDPATLTIEEQNGLLEPWFESMESDLAALRLAVEQARSAGQSEVMQRLHRADVDHEMLDQAYKYGGGDGET